MAAVRAGADGGRLWRVMANREKNEVALTVDGKEYTLVLNTSAMVAAEEACLAEKADAVIGALTMALRQIAIKQPDKSRKQPDPQFPADLQMMATAALAAASRSDMTWDVFFARVLGGSIKYVRVLIWAMLQKYHPETTLSDAGALIDGVGGIGGLTGILTASSDASTPDPRDAEALGIGARKGPRKAQASATRTGGRSTAKRASSA